MKRKNQAFFIAAVLAVVVVGTILAITNGNKRGSSTTPSATTGNKAASSDSSSAVATTAVAIKDYMFSPMVIKVKVGDTVTWTNQDNVHHNVVADSTAADAPNGPLIGEGEVYKFTFRKAGTYTFHCVPHPYMHGTVEVTN